MWPRPEAHGFTKFVLSVGAFLCVAAVVVPALILRETDVLLVPERDIEELTKVGRQEITSRQETSHDLGVAAPFIFGVLLVGGVGLIIYGLPRLKRQEDKAEEKESMELSKLRSELKPQSEEEQQAQLFATVEEDEKPLRPAFGAPPAEPTAPRDPRARMHRALEVEEQVLDRIEALAPPAYEFKRRVKATGAPNLLVDGVLLSTVDQLPDFVIEIKLGGRYLDKNLRNRLADVLLRLTSYRNHFGRNTKGWLIFVLEEPLSAAQRDQILERASDVDREIVVSLVNLEDISQLELPTK